MAKAKRKKSELQELREYHDSMDVVMEELALAMEDSELNDASDPEIVAESIRELKRLRRDNICIWKIIRDALVSRPASVQQAIDDAAAKIQEENK